jgi:glutathione S-transferase
MYLTPAVFSRPDFGSLRPSALAEFKSVLDIVENSFLGSGKGCIGGDSLSIGDIHVGAVVKWVLETLGVNQMPAFDNSEYPRIYQW